MRTNTAPLEILVAEDNSADVVLVRKALEIHQLQCALHVIPDGALAIKWLDSLDANPAQKPLDLVLLDLHLPKRNGTEILKHLRSTKRYSQTPVVMMTSLDAHAVKDRIGASHPPVYFMKPSTLDEFMELGSVVRRVLYGEKQSIGSENALQRAGSA